MKISKLFHWLYASVMLLPLFGSIVFAIYTRNENSTFTQTVDYEINKVVDFNQLYTGYNDTFSQNGIDVTFNDYYISFNGTSTVEGNFISLFSFPVQVNHVYYLRDFGGGSLQDYDFYGFYDVNQTSLSTYNGNFTFVSAYNDNLDFRIVLSRSGFLTYDMGFYFNVFDLTQMFGSGDEPSIEQFNVWYPNDYYGYTLGTKQLLNVDTATYSNTDVGSQLIYTLYNSTNNYFNVTNFLGLNNLYDWISINVFNGTPALAFSLFYMLLSYWLLVSIFWLVFDVVMYVPNLAHRWLDKGSLQ